jgi:hypothetical protein
MDVGVGGRIELLGKKGKDIHKQLPGGQGSTKGKNLHMIRQHDNELMCKSLKALAQPLLAPSGFAGAPAPRDGLGIGKFCLRGICSRKQFTINFGITLTSLEHPSWMIALSVRTLLQQCSEVYVYLRRAQDSGLFSFSFQAGGCRILPFRS